MIEKQTLSNGREGYIFWCDPCDTHHSFTTKPGAGDHPDVAWSFNGDMEAPTFSPSLHVNPNLTPEHRAAGAHRCHLFLRKGMVQYLNDCTHELAGKTVKVQPPR